MSPPDSFTTWCAEPGGISNPSPAPTSYRVPSSSIVSRPESTKKNWRARSDVQVSHLRSAVGHTLLDDTQLRRANQVPAVTTLTPRVMLRSLNADHGMQNVHGA